MTYVQPTGDKTIDHNINLMRSNNVSEDDIQAYVTNAQAQAAKDNPQVFWGSWTTPTPGAPGLTGYPGAYQGATMPQYGAPKPGEAGFRSEYDKSLQGGGQTSQRDPTLKTSEDAIYWFQQGLYNGDPQALHIKQQMIDAGVIQPGADFTEAMSGFSRFVSLSAGALKHGEYVSPFDYLDMLEAQVKHDPQVTTSTSTTTNVLNPTDVAAAYQQTAEQALGRRATTAEARAAAGVAGRAAAASPTTSRTTSTTRGANTTSSTVTNQGLGAAGVDEILMQQAMQSPDYGAYQAAGHYFPALLSVLGAVNQAGA